MTILGILIRIFPHPPNFTPISATAIFGGAKLNKKYALILPLVTLSISDYLLLYIHPFGNPMFDFSRIQPISAMFHSTTLFVWGSLVISGLIGLFIRSKNKPVFIIGASLISSIQFFLITNFAVWMGGYYGLTINGLLESYVQGLPFFQWTILGDLFYTVAFFGIYGLSSRFSKSAKLEFVRQKAQD